MTSPQSSPQHMEHTFSGNRLDRADAKRRNKDWLAEAYARSDALVLPFWRQRVLLQVDPAQTESSLAWRSTASLREHNSTEAIFLGLQDNVPYFAQSLKGSEAPALDDAKFTDCRAAAMTLESQDSGIIAQARAQLEWHKSNLFCGRCGTATEMQRGGHLRVCNECSAKKFPRTDPVVIMLISRGDQCLLGQPNGPIAGSGFYTSLAGFVDQGESIEEAVRRETWEEAGLPVGKVHYHSSQPWPFPHTLMIGCHGEALSDEINMDTDEMADVRWFSREEVRSVLNAQVDLPQKLPQQLSKQGADSSDGKPPPVRVPGPMAIAHHLINAWADGEANTQF